MLALNKRLAVFSDQSPTETDKIRQNTGQKRRNLEMKASRFFTRAALWIMAVLLCFLPGTSARADTYATWGDCATTVTFFAVSTGNGSVTFLQSKGSCIETNKTYQAYGLTETKEEWGKYHIQIVAPSGASYTEEWNKTSYGSKYTVQLPFAGTYRITLTPYTGQEMTDSWSGNQFVRWATVPEWWITGTEGCSCFERDPNAQIYTSGTVDLYYYIDGKLDDFQTVILYASQEIAPKAISGYVCTSGSQSVSFDPYTGQCTPSSLSFFYTKGYGSGTVTISYYKDGYYSESQTKTISSSQYIWPKSISGYTCTSGGQYVTFDPSTGSCSPSVLYFYYIQDTPATVVAPYDWDTQFKPGTATAIADGKIDNENRYLHLPDLYDDNPSTSFWWLIWKSERTDDIPEISALFHNATVSAVGIRNGNTSSEAAYETYAKARKFLVRIYYSGGVKDTYITLENTYSRNYQKCSLGGTYSGVTRIDFFLDGGGESCVYLGKTETYYIHISDMQFYE